jgi:hypothetical protein
MFDPFLILHFIYDLHILYLLYFGPLLHSHIVIPTLIARFHDNLIT